MIYSIDFAVLDFIQETMRCAFLDVVMAVFSYMGEAGGIWIITAVIMLCFRKTRATGVMLITAVLAGFLIGEIGLKNIVCRARPFTENPLVVPAIKLPSGYSFPSGHSCSSFAAATLIAFSRLYNYVHFPSDVLCGIILGVTCAIITIVVFRKTGLDKKLSGDLKYKKVDDNG